MPKRPIYFSFFMFTADVRPNDAAYSEILIKHMKSVAALGYDGFDLHIAAQPPAVDHQLEVESYKRLRAAIAKERDLEDLTFTTNVGTTRTFDPTSPYEEQRAGALRYLESRVEITSILNGGRESIMSGPFLYPYGVFPVTDDGESIWSDALRDWMAPRYRAACSVFRDLTSIAAKRNVKLAIEPVKSWETPPPNMVSEVLDFLDLADATFPCGVTIDTAQVVMESQGPEVFKRNVMRAVEKNRLFYVHVSAPDRGAVSDSWIPWDAVLGEIEPVYDGPYLVEVFNAIPPFDSSMRMARRRFWRPGEDPRGLADTSAYAVAEAALRTVRGHLDRVRAVGTVS